MNRLLLAILILVGVSARGAVYMNYYTTNASPTLPGSVTATNAIGNNGGTGTNTWLGGVTTITNLVLPAGFTNAWKSDATNAAASKIAMNGGTGTNIVLEGLTTATNLSVTKLYDSSGVASTIAAFNAGTNLYSVANGAGFLENDGGGAFTWTTSLNASNLSGNVPNSSIPGWVASGTDVVNATNSNALHMNATNLLNNVQVGNLNGGSSASATTYWRGDGTWATPAGSGNGTLNTVATNGTAVSAAATNLNLYAGANVTINATNAGNRVDVTITSTASGTTGAVTNGDTRTIGVSGLIVSNTMSAGEFDTGTLVVTNPPALNLSASTNYGGTYYASNAISGGQFPIGSLATGVTAVAGPFLTSNTVARSYSYNAGGLTNISPANIVIGTLPQAILSSATSALSGPAENELPTAQWVRSLFNNGIIDYTSTNIMAGATNTDLIGGAPIYTFQSTIPISDARVYSGATVVTNNAYIGSVMTTNQFTFIQGPIDVNAFVGQNGSANESVSIHPEIYYSYDKTNWLGDWTASAHTLTHASTNLHQWVISFPAVTSTNSTGFYIQRRFKVDTASGTTPSVVFVIGTNAASGINNASHIALSGPSSAAGNAYLANNQTFTGNNTFTAGTRTFSHDTIHTVITNTATLTSSEWTAGSQKEWYNGNVMMTIDKTNGTITATGNLGLSTVGITIDGGGSAITSGTKGYIEIPTACTIKSGILLADQNGSIQVETWRTNSTGFPATLAGSIGTNFLTSTNWLRDSTLSGWTTSLATGDILAFNVTTNASAITRCTLQLKVQK